MFKKIQKQGTSLVVQWLRLHASIAGGLDVIHGQGTASHTPQLKIPCAVRPGAGNKNNEKKMPRQGKLFPYDEVLC